MKTQMSKKLLDMVNEINTKYLMNLKLIIYIDNISLGKASIKLKLKNDKNEIMWEWDIIHNIKKGDSITVDELTFSHPIKFI